MSRGTCFLQLRAKFIYWNNISNVFFNIIHQLRLAPLARLIIYAGKYVACESPAPSGFFSTAFRAWSRTSAYELSTTHSHTALFFSIK